MIHLSSSLGIRAAALLLYNPEAQFKKIRETVELYGYSFLEEFSKYEIDPNAFGYESLMREGLSEGWMIYGPIGGHFSTQIRHTGFAEDLDVLTKHFKDMELHSTLKYGKWIAVQDKTIPCKYLPVGHLNEIKEPHQVYIVPGRLPNVLTMYINNPITKVPEEVAYFDYATDVFSSWKKATQRNAYLQDRLDEQNYCFRSRSPGAMPKEFNEFIITVQMICRRPKKIESFNLKDEEIFVSQIIEGILDVFSDFHANCIGLLTLCSQKLLLDSDSDYSEQAEKEYISYLTDRFQGRGSVSLIVTSEFREDVNQLISQQFQALQTFISNQKKIKQLNLKKDREDLKAYYYKAITDEVSRSIQSVTERIHRSIEQCLMQEFYTKGYLNKGALTRKGVLFLLCSLGFVSKR